MNSSWTQRWGWGVLLALSSCHRTPSRMPDVPPRVLRPADVNGDGFADLLVGEGAIGARLYLGGRNGYAATPAVRIGTDAASAERVTAGVMLLSDSNGDGFADAVIADKFHAEGQSEGCARGQLRVFAGAATASLSRVLVTLTAPDGVARLGRSLVSLGDLDGDRDDEVLVFANRTTAGHRWVRASEHRAVEQYAEFCSEPSYFLLRGGSAPTLEPLPLEGASGSAPTAVVGRFDGDERSDLVLLSRRLPLYVGESSGFRRSPSYLLGEDEAFDYTHLATGDLNGDGHADLVLARNPGVSAAPARVLFGPFVAGSAPRSADVGASEQNDGVADRIRSVLIPGDWTGDRIADLLVGDPAHDRVLLFSGGPSFPGAAPRVLEPASSLHKKRIGAWLTNAGDIDGDGVNEVLAMVQSPSELHPWSPVLLLRGGQNSTYSSVLQTTSYDEAPWSIGALQPSWSDRYVRIPPVPRRCNIPSPTEHPELLVRVTVSTNPLETMLPSPVERRLPLLPALPLQQLQQRAQGIVGRLAVCHADNLAVDCNRRGSTLYSLSVQNNGRISPAGHNAIEGTDRFDDCVSEAVASLRLDPFPGPSNGQWAARLSLTFLPGPP